jgi:hypothetical protein
MIMHINYTEVVCFNVYVDICPKIKENQKQAD